MTERPNIVFIICDELRADALGYAGNPIGQTPNIDRLAAEGTIFTQCMVTQPTCTPSRASMLSGCYPSTLHSRMVGCITPDDPRFFPRVLAENGYRTASIGKIHLVPQRDEPERMQQALATSGNYFGFQEINLVNGHGDGCFGPDYTPWLEERVPDWKHRIQQRKPYEHGVNAYEWPLPPEVHSSVYIADRTIEFLQSADDTPFFLHVSFPDPHYPFTVPEPYASRYDPAEMPPPLPPVTQSRNLPPLHEQVYKRRESITRPDGRPADRVIGTPPHEYAKLTTEDWQQVKAIYYGMITLIDDQIGRILDALDAQGLAGDTLVVFASDHGDYLGDHGFYGKGLPYDSVLRVPLLFRGPGIPAGHRLESVASTLDLAPTLLDFAGVSEPEGVQGNTMYDLLTGIETAVRAAVLTENDDDFVPMKMRVLTTSQWKLVYYLREAYGELYDRLQDTSEMTNLWEDEEYRTIKSQLLQILLEEVITSQDMANGRVQPPNPPPPKWAARELPQSLTRNI